MFELLFANFKVSLRKTFFWLIIPHLIEAWHINLPYLYKSFLHYISEKVSFIPSGDAYRNLN